jgi:glycosyltransferase involved in cell wall biosynthesis
VGSQNKSYFLRYGLKNDHLTFVQHAVDNDRFKKSPDSVQKGRELRERLGIPESAPVFLFAGKMEEKKDPLLLLKSFLAINAPGAHLVMTGNGVLEQRLKELAGANKNVHFLPFQNQTEMPGLYQAADIFVLPSRGTGETWGLAINEAMAAGKVILASNACGATADIVEEGGNGFVFESENKADLQLKLKNLLDIKPSWPQMGNRSEEIIKEWNFTSCCLVIEKILQR